MAVCGQLEREATFILSSGNPDQFLIDPNPNTEPGFGPNMDHVKVLKENNISIKYAVFSNILVDHCKGLLNLKKCLKNI